MGFSVGAIMYIVIALTALGNDFSLVPGISSIFVHYIFYRGIVPDQAKFLVKHSFQHFPDGLYFHPFRHADFPDEPPGHRRTILTGIYFSAFFFILWSNDTFAYLVGMVVGKHKLFEKISPKKTWEGTIGGIFFGLLAAFILSLFFKELMLWQWLVAAMIINISGIFGDLSESLLKRHFNVKDSGSILPGHGGILRPV